MQKKTRLVTLDEAKRGGKTERVLLKQKIKDAR